MNKIRVVSCSLPADRAEALENYAAGRGLYLSNVLQEIVLAWFRDDPAGQALDHGRPEPPKPKGSIWDKL